MKDKTDLISIVCSKLLSGEINDAEKELSEWPFKQLTNEPKRNNIPPSEQIKVFLRDNFTCRYCGKRTIFTQTLRVISIKLPKTFPYHPNWKWNNIHPAYWELASSCDHLTPVARGGNNNHDNLVTACYKCNSIKTNWTLEELGWKLHEPSNIKWDGLVKVFIQIYEQEKIHDKSLQKWYRILKK